MSKHFKKTEAERHQRCSGYVEGVKHSEICPECEGWVDMLIDPDAKPEIEVVEVSLGFMAFHLGPHGTRQWNRKTKAEALSAARAALRSER